MARPRNRLQNVRKRSWIGVRANGRYLTIAAAIRSASVEPASGITVFQSNRWHCFAWNGSRTQSHREAGGDSRRLSESSGADKQNGGESHAQKEGETGFGRNQEMIFLANRPTGWLIRA